MKKILICLYAMLQLTTSLFAEDGNQIGLSAGIDYSSTYLWRGTYWYNGDGAFFPSVTYEKGGFSIGYAGEYSEDIVTRKDPDISNPGFGIANFHAADFGIGYSHSIDGIATVGVDVWYYYFYNDDTLSFITGTISVTFDTLPLSPTITYNHDYYTDSKDKKDFYIQFGLGYEKNIKDAGLSLGIIAGYYSADSTDQKGLSDITTTAGLTITVNGVSFSGSYNYVYIPSKDFYQATIYSGIDDKHRTFATFGASYSL